MSEERAVAVRQSGQLSTEKTKALWAATGQPMSPQVVEGLNAVGEFLGLSPALGEVMILGGKVYIPLQGYLAIANRYPQYEGYEIWPLGEAERKSLMVGDNEIAFGCKVWRKDKRFPFAGWGVASDRTVSMPQMKIHLREVAEARALRRALKAAFPASVPGGDEDFIDMQNFQRAEAITVELLEAADEPPKEPQPDWSTFWIAVEGLGVSQEDAHRILGVESVKDWTGSLEDAYQRIEQHQAAKERERAEKEQAGNVKRWNRQSLIDRYAQLADMADVLGISYKALELTWTDEQIVSEGEALKAACKTKQAAIPVANQST